MFGFANFLLLALFAAVVFDLIFALARGGGLRGALHGLWNTPHLLFGQQLAEWRLQLGRILFAAGLAAYEISVVFCNSMARQNWAWVQGVMSPVLEWLAFLCFGAKILFGTRYTWRELLAGGALYFLPAGSISTARTSGGSALWWRCLPPRMFPCAARCRSILPAAVPPWRWCWHCTLPGSLPQT